MTSEQLLPVQDWQWLADQLRAWPEKRVHPERTMCEGVLRPMAADVIEAALARLSAIPTALPGAEDALRARALAFLAERIVGNDPVKLAVSNGDLTVVRSLATDDVISLMIDFAALQSPRASDEVPAGMVGKVLRETLQRKADRVHPTNRRPGLPMSIKVSYGDLCTLITALKSQEQSA